MAKVQKMLVSLNLSGNELINAVLGTEAGTKNGAVWFDLASGRVAIKDGNGTTQYLTPKSYVDAEVAGEAATRASEITRELPAPPVFFGVLAFVVLTLLLYLTLRLGK